MKNTVENLLKPIYILALVVGVMACSPSINPAMKDSIDTRLSVVQSSPNQYDATTTGAGYVAGSWLKYKTLDEQGHPGIVTYKLLASEGNLHTIETIAETYYNRSNTYLELSYEIGAPIGTLEIRRAITQIDDGAVSESSSMELSIMGSMYRSMAGQLFYREQETGTSSAEVIAGQFAGCTEKDSTLRFGPVSYSAHSWHHGAVPMHGMVRSERSDGKPGITELMSFGTTGAQSELLPALR